MKKKKSFKSMSVKVHRDKHSVLFPTSTGDGNLLALLMAGNHLGDRRTKRREIREKISKHKA